MMNRISRVKCFENIPLTLIEKFFGQPFYRVDIGSHFIAPITSSRGLGIVAHGNTRHMQRYRENKDQARSAAAFNLASVSGVNRGTKLFASPPCTVASQSAASASTPI